MQPTLEEATSQNQSHVQPKWDLNPQPPAHDAYTQPTIHRLRHNTNYKSIKTVYNNLGNDKNNVVLWGQKQNKGTDHKITKFTMPQLSFKITLIDKNKHTWVLNINYLQIKMYVKYFVQAQSSNLVISHKTIKFSPIIHKCQGFL